MQGKSFSYSGALGFGWSVMKDNFLFFLGVIVVSTLLSSLGQILREVMKRHPEVIPQAVLQAIPPFWFFAMVAVSFIIVIIVGIGLTKITLSFCDGLKPNFGTLFNGLDCFWRYIGAGLLYVLIIGGASMACILLFTLPSNVMGCSFSAYLAFPFFAAIFIPIAILSIKFSLCFYFVVDKGLGPIKALKASSRATRGAILSLFVFGILCGLVNFLGALCFLIGLFATIPTVMVAIAFVYRQLSEQTPELAELGITGPNVRPCTIASGIQSIGGSQFASVIQSVMKARPDQSVQSKENIQADSAKPALAVAAGPADGIQQQEGGKKRNKPFLRWLTALVILSVMLAAGIGYRLWPGLKGKLTISSKNTMNSTKEAMTIPKEVPLKGILYSEDNPSAIIDGQIAKEGDRINDINVVKIYKDRVEFEKGGVKWTQRAR
jgi:hypothetical protein